MKTKLLGIMVMLFLSLGFRADGDINKIKNKKTYDAAALSELTKNLEYDFDKPAVRAAYYKKLDELADAVKSENYVVSLRGHADGIGAYKYNWVLSDKRAVSVKDYLVSKGVKTDRVVTTPFGSTIPIASNKTESGRQKNRRVEISLKKIS
ncbi:MAG: OmpA family protein [Pedobacter sp.]|nr:MAG: OmpA family protein [Pedobacter sp.]